MYGGYIDVVVTATIRYSSAGIGPPRQQLNDQDNSRHNDRAACHVGFSSVAQHEKDIEQSDHLRSRRFSRPRASDEKGTFGCRSRSRFRWMRMKDNGVPGSSSRSLSEMVRDPGIERRRGATGRGSDYLK